MQKCNKSAFHAKWSVYFIACKITWLHFALQTSSFVVWPLDYRQRSMIAGCRGQGQRALIQSILGSYRNELALSCMVGFVVICEPDCCSSSFTFKVTVSREEREGKTFSCYMCSDFLDWTQQCSVGWASNRRRERKTLISLNHRVLLQPSRAPETIFKFPVIKMICIFLLVHMKYCF